MNATVDQLERKIRQIAKEISQSTDNNVPRLLLKLKGNFVYVFILSLTCLKLYAFVAKLFHLINIASMHIKLQIYSEVYISARFRGANCCFGSTTYFKWWSLLLSKTYQKLLTAGLWPRNLHFYSGQWVYLLYYLNWDKCNKKSKHFELW